MKNIFDNLKTLLQSPNISSKNWIYQQYDSQVMNDTIQTGGDAAIVRIHNSKKAVVATTDCTPRYVEADAFEGAKQAVAETYRNISAVGGKPLAITNCLNFGNPQKPEIMGQIVQSIKGINQACLELDYPVVSGNVSLYNETDGKAIKPTPAIGGVGLINDIKYRAEAKFHNQNEVIILIGETNGHLECSLFNIEILGIKNLENPPFTNLSIEKRNGEFIRELISNSIISTCHDISDGGLLVALFEMSTSKIGCELDFSNIELYKNNKNAFLFGEDQSRYIITAKTENLDKVIKTANEQGIAISIIGKTIAEIISIENNKVAVRELIHINEELFPSKFS